MEKQITMLMYLIKMNPIGKYPPTGGQGVCHLASSAGVASWGGGLWKAIAVLRDQTSL